MIYSEWKLSSYAVFVLIGVLTSGFVVCRTAKKRGHDDNDYIVFMLISAIGVFIGGHILYGVTQMTAFWEVVTHWGKYIKSIGDFIAIFSYIFGGSVFYGGLLGGIAAGLIYGKIKRLDLWNIPISSRRQFLCSIALEGSAASSAAAATVSSVTAVGSRFTETLLIPA